MRAALNFSVSEKRGILVLISIMTLTYVIPFIIDALRKKEEKITVETTLIQFKKKQSEFDAKKKNENVSPIIFFNFDPNQIEYSEWKKLGFPKYLIERIIKYRKAGGRFFQKEDLKKIYGITESRYMNLEPYIVIEEGRSNRPKKKTVEKVIVNIGEADSSVLTLLKGIGPIYAQRIILYRLALGGFINIEQLKEVYGISDSLYLSLSSSIIMDTNVELRQIKINVVELNDLRKHPYFRNYNLSRAIINYREMNGPYKDKEDLGRIHIMTDSILARIFPYLDFE